MSLSPLSNAPKEMDSEAFTYIRVNDFLPFLKEGQNLAWTNTHPTLEQISKEVLPECQNNFAVILNGVYVPSLSRLLSGITIQSISEIIKLSDFHSEDPAASSARANSHPIRIDIAAKSQIAEPLLLLFYQNFPQEEIRDQEKNHYFRGDSFIQVQANEQSEMTLLTKSISSVPVTGHFMNNLHIHIDLADEASVKYASAGEQAENLIYFSKLSADLNRNSRLFAATAASGTRLTRQSFSFDLKAEGAEAEVNGASVLTGSRQAHQFVQIRHSMPHGQSRQHFKTVAAEKSKASFDGTVIVAEGAQQTNASQLINNLMLSDEARADTKPRLMIYADDVKCAHGATVGKLDPAQAFYLQSRGLTAVQSQMLLTLAFIGEIVLKVPSAGLRGEWERLLIEPLKAQLLGKGV